MRNARRAYSSWSSATLGGTIVRAASEIWLGALPTATRAISASLSGVAKRRRGRDLIEREVAVAEGLVERRQLAQRLGRSR